MVTMPTRRPTLKCKANRVRCPDPTCRHVQPAPRTPHGKSRGRGVDACAACEQACTVCSTQMMDCSVACMNCADMCGTMMRSMMRMQGMTAPVMMSMLDACIAMCRMCMDECMQHAEHSDVCRMCAQACKACMDACMAMRDMMTKMAS